MANLNVKQLFTNILNKLKANDDKIGNTTMGTTATTITGAIAEHEQDISDLNSKTTHTITGSTRAYKCGNNVTIRFSVNDKVSSIINADALPVSYRPTDSLYGSVIIENDNGACYDGYVLINANGKINVYILQTYGGSITKIEGGTVWVVLGSITYIAK